MSMSALKAEIAALATPMLEERYALYLDLRSVSVGDIIRRDIMELELARRGIWEDLGPYRTINS